MNKQRTIFLWLLVALFFFFALNTHRQAYFSDIATQVGVKKPFRLSINPNAEMFPTPMTGGAAWADYDNDGNLDLYVASLYREQSNSLFRNNGDGTFTEVTQEARLSYYGHSWGAVFADYNNDGWPDLYVTNFGSEESFDAPGEMNILYRNNGDGTFTDVTEEAGVGGGILHSAGAAWADYDNDGNLDLYVANHGVVDYPKVLAEPNQLFRNNGDGTFVDVAEQLGVADISELKDSRFLPEPRPTRTDISFQPVWFDYDNNGTIDLFVATDFGISPLYRNNGDGTFTDVTQEVGLQKEGNGMGVAVGDYDNNGHLDLYLTNFFENFLWRNNGDGTFTDVAEEAGIADLGVGWGTGFLDFDNDGDLDLFVTNGAEGPKWNDKERRIPNSKDVFYENTGDGTFKVITKRAGVTDDKVTMGTAFADFNNDGFVDIYVMEIEGEHRLFRNNKNKSLLKNNWITIRLVGTKSNRDAIGARVRVTSGGKTQTQQVLSGGSYLSQSSPWLTFGLGKTSQIEKIEITWPNGSVQSLENIKADQLVTVTEE